MVTGDPLQAATIGHEALTLAYYHRAAALYAEIAEIDRGHHHEALYMAEQAWDSVTEIEAKIPLQRQSMRDRAVGW
jgi:hypothetical protein